MVRFVESRIDGTQHLSFEWPLVTNGCIREHVGALILNLSHDVVSSEFACVEIVGG
jgi:hypothetical protein